MRPLPFLRLDDLSGPYYPHLTHASFSKPFLIRMMHAWQYAWLVMNEGYYLTVRMRYGSDVAGACEFGAWTRVAEKVNQAKRRYAKVGNIEAEDGDRFTQAPATAAG